MGQLGSRLQQADQRADEELVRLAMKKNHSSLRQQIRSGVGEVVRHQLRRRGLTALAGFGKNCSSVGSGPMSLTRTRAPFV